MVLYNGQRYSMDSNDLFIAEMVHAELSCFCRDSMILSSGHYFRPGRGTAQVRVGHEAEYEH